MNPWVKRKWVRALRSGEYGKGSNHLGNFSVNKYCCLGVLACELVPEFAETDLYGNLTVDQEDGFLPDDLAILWGLDTYTQERLANINDNAESFEPVIAYIEENL